MTFARLCLTPRSCYVVFRKQNFDEGGAIRRIGGEEQNRAARTRWRADDSLPQERQRSLAPRGPCRRLRALGVPFQELVVLEGGTRFEVAPHEGHRVVVAAAAVVFGGQELDQAGTGVFGKCLYSTLGPGQRVIVALRVVE